MEQECLSKQKKNDRRDGHQLRRRIGPLLDFKNTSNWNKELYYVNLYSVLDWMEKKAKKEGERL